jgi:hypothetical protein
MSRPLSAHYIIGTFQPDEESQNLRKTQINNVLALAIRKRVSRQTIIANERRRQWFSDMGDDETEN